MTLDLQALLDELGKVLDGKKVDGPCDRYAFSVGSARIVCGRCRADGLDICSTKVPDKAYDGLREVFRERCVCRRGAHTEYIHQRCKGTGYITRSIEGWPKGALKGAIEWALISTAVPGIVWENFLAYHSESPEVPDDDDLASVQAVLEAIEEGGAR